MPSEISFETEYPDSFAKDTAKDISAALFSKNEAPVSEEIQQVAPSTPEPKVAKPAPEPEKHPNIVSGVNSEVTPNPNPNPAKPLPKSWKKDMEAEWTKLPASVHDYVYAREADVMRGIQQYQVGHNQWNTLVQPFLPVLQAHPEISPVQVLQGLMNTHLTLLDPKVSSAQKAQLAAQLLSQYGITLDPAAVTPESNILQQKISQLETQLSSIVSDQTRRQQEETQRGLNTWLTKVQEFSSDPKNQFYSEVEADILRFVQTGAAKSLEDAYDLACYANPAVRAKMLSTPAPKTPAPNVSRDAKGKFINVETPEEPLPRTRKKGSIEDTINDIVNSHYSKH